MEYVVYHKASGEILKAFNSAAGARRSATCMNRNAGDVYYTSADRDTYERRMTPRMKSVRNLMTGEMIEIAEDTPYCCDPSSERYWNM